MLLPFKDALIAYFAQHRIRPEDVCQKHCIIVNCDIPSEHCAESECRVHNVFSDSI